MTRRRASEPGNSKTRVIGQYEHPKKTRVNNPQIGLVTAKTDPDKSPKKTYKFDPNVDPRLEWAGKEESLSFDVPTVSLNVHERIDPRTIIEAIRKQPDTNSSIGQPSLFESPGENLPLRDAIEFYKHKHGWSNRLIAGDSLLVVNSMLEKEGMAGQIQMAYVDPPYGVRYRSNFQPFVNQRDVKEGKDEDLTQEPEMIRAFRDTWELGIHSYLTYLRDRLLLIHKTLSEDGSIFVQIGDENVHLVRQLLDEVFGAQNFVNLIAFTKAGGGLESKTRLSSRLDYLIWYSKSANFKYQPLFEERADAIGTGFDMVESPSGERRRLSPDERAGRKPLPPGRLFMSVLLTKPGPGSKYEIAYQGKTYNSGNRWWGTPKESLERVIAKNRVIASGNTMRFVRYLDDFPLKNLSNLWDGIGGAANPIYVVQTSEEVVKRCMLMTTLPGDLVLDPTCGSGTTAYIAEQWGRRWVTCDTSRVAIALAKQRLMTAAYDYYELAHAEEGVDSGFRYKSLPKVTLQSIANNEPATRQDLYDQPFVDSSKVRVTGPFTVEAVPAPSVRPMDDSKEETQADESVVRSGATLRESEWRDELLKTGIRGKGGQIIRFSRVEPLAGTRYVHADAASMEEQPQRVVISFGPDFAPLEPRQVELAWEEARTLAPRPTILVFAAFQFDPEASKDIDELRPEKTGMLFLKAQMNPDLLTEDLKKKRTSNQSFWLVGQPDIEISKVSGAASELFQAKVRGFDYYNVRTGLIESGDTSKIVMWLLDPDYDGRSLFPRQVFFPASSDRFSWEHLRNNLRAELDEERLVAYSGVTSLPFLAGKHARVAIKIIDDRGIESLKVVQL